MLRRHFSLTAAVSSEGVAAPHSSTAVGSSRNVAASVSVAATVVVVVEPEAEEPFGCCARGCRCRPGIDGGIKSRRSSGGEQRQRPGKRP